MTEENLRIGLADDIPEIHESIKSFLTGRGFKYELTSFYDTDSLKDFLWESSEIFDLLLLDVHFGPGESGIEALPTIRDLAPTLPIILLTGETRPDILGLAAPYDIYYLSKPVGANQIEIAISNAIGGVRRRKAQVEEALGKYAWMAEELSRRNSASEVTKIREGVLDDKSLREITTAIFPDVEFTTHALRSLRPDPNLFRLLKSVDWKIQPPSGAKPIRFRRDPKNWEYRIDRKSRLYVEYRKGDKPLIKTIDWDHFLSGK